MAVTVAATMSPCNNEYRLAPGSFPGFEGKPQFRVRDRKASVQMNDPWPTLLANDRYLRNPAVPTGIVRLPAQAVAGISGDWVLALEPPALRWGADCAPRNQEG
jgi:hypothetical protein